MWEEKTCVILTADKGVALVVLDKQDYLQKVENFLEQWNTYRPISSDHPNKQKNKLINLLNVYKQKKA